MKILRSQEGQQVRVLSDDICIKLKSSDSPNQMTVVTVVVPPGGAVPAHTHSLEEESYYMLDGSMHLQLNGEEFEISSGDFVHIPQGTIHAYWNSSDRSTRFLAWVVGGAIDDFFIEMAEKVQQLPNDLPKIPEILDKYGVKMVN